MPVLTSGFRPPAWLRNGHLQTVWPVLRPRHWALVHESERLELPDGDFLDLAWLRRDRAGRPADRLAVLTHGLESDLSRRLHPGHGGGAASGGLGRAGVELPRLRRRAEPAAAFLPQRRDGRPRRGGPPRGGPRRVRARGARGFQPGRQRDAQVPGRSAAAPGRPRGGGDLRAGGPGVERGHARPPPREPDLPAAVHPGPGGQGGGEGATLSRPVRPARHPAGPHVPGVRRPLHVPAARLP